MAFDLELAQRIRLVLPAGEGITEKRMFGGLAFLVHGTMFVGIVGDALMARVGPHAYDAALARPHVREMDFSGKPMRGYVYVDPPGLTDPETLARWVADCHTFALSLPRKEAR